MNCRVTGFLFAEENSMTDFHSRRYARQQYLWRSWDSFIYFHLLTFIWLRRKRKRYNCAFIAMFRRQINFLPLISNRSIDDFIDPKPPSDGLAILSIEMILFRQF